MSGPSPTPAASGMTVSATGSLAAALPPRAEAARQARSLTRAAIDVWKLGPAHGDDVLVVVSELVTNAVLHAVPPISLKLRHVAGSAVLVEVADGGPATAVPEEIARRKPAECGRGQDVVATLAKIWGIRRDGGRTTRWAEVRDMTGADRPAGPKDTSMNEYQVTFEVRTPLAPSHGVASIAEWAATREAAMHQAVDELMDRGWTVVAHVSTETRAESGSCFDPTTAHSTAASS